MYSGIYSVYKSRAHLPLKNAGKLFKVRSVGARLRAKRRHPFHHNSRVAVLGLDTHEHVEEVFGTSRLVSTLAKAGGLVRLAARFL